MLNKTPCVLDSLIYAIDSRYKIVNTYMYYFKNLPIDDNKVY
jgi:hypothetical protein